MPHNSLFASDQLSPRFAHGTNPKHLRIALVIFVLFTASATAGNRSSEIELLWESQQWELAAKAMFLEARELNQYETDIITGQAKAGFIDDALATIEKNHSGSRTYLLIILATEARSLSPEKKQEIVRQAILHARTSDRKSYNLSIVALYLSRQIRIIASKKLFLEAINIAERQISTSNSGDFRDITGLIFIAASMMEKPGVRPWMLATLDSVLRTTPSPEDLAFSCIDLIKVSATFSNTVWAKRFIQCAEASSRKIPNALRRKIAVRALERSKIEIEGSDSNSSTPPSILAIREARAGNIQEAHEIISNLGKTLYVNYQTEAYRAVFNDALKRHDLESATYLAEHSLNSTASTAINTWRSLAEEQISLGDKKSGLLSLDKAASAATEISKQKSIYANDIRSISQLGTSYIDNGMPEKGIKHLLLSLELLGEIPERRITDRIKSELFVADKLLHAGLRKEAIDAIHRSYKLSQTIPTDDKRRRNDKSRSLAAVALATSSLTQ